MTTLKKYKEIIFVAFSFAFLIFSLGLNVQAQEALNTNSNSTSNLPVQNTCRPLISHYLGYGLDNDPTQVKFLQAFLKGIEGHNLEVTGVFDNDTYNAVHSFQRKYASEILSPWGLGVEGSTGYVYFTTQNKINEIYCGREIPLSGIQKAQIAEAIGVEVAKLDEDGIVAGTVSQENATTVELTLTDTTEKGESKDVIKEAASSVFETPKDTREAAFYGLWFILILALVYILGSLIAGMRDTEGLSQNQLRMRKIVYFMAGTLIGLVVAVALKLSTIVVPLIIVMVVLSLGLIYYSRKNS